MRRILLVCLLLGGCNAVTDFDRFREADAASDAPLPEPITSGPNGATPTSGGSVALRSASHRLHVFVGAPQPMGETSSATRAATLGPEALR